MPVRPWQPELQRLCSHFVFESDEPTDPKQQFRNPTKQSSVCWYWGSSTTDIYPQANCLLGTAGERQPDLHLGRCCLGEVGGRQHSSLHTHLLHNDTCNQYFRFCCSAVGTGAAKLQLPAQTFSLLTSGGSKHHTNLGGAEVGMSSCQFPGKGNT